MVSEGNPVPFAQHAVSETEIVRIDLFLVLARLIVTKLQLKSSSAQLEGLVSAS
jgi:hypothetical protein